MEDPRPPIKTKRCPNCLGNGHFTCAYCRGKGTDPENSQQPCPVCYGRKTIICATCQGRGEVVAE